MIGKLAKFAAGNESVHSTKSRQDFDFLATLAASVGGDGVLLDRIRIANTAQEASDLVLQARLTEFHPRMCERAWQFAQTIVQDRYRLDVSVTGIHEQVLGRYP